MAVDTNLVKLAVDTYHGTPEKYSVKESSEALRKALIEINGGENLDYKKMRAGASNGLFQLVEQILPRTVVEGLTSSDFFNAFVDFRNMAEGDAPVFEVEDVNWYEIGPVAHGSRGLRRQRLGGRTSKTVNTVLHGVRIYEPMRRLLAGRVDFNQFIDDVAKSYQKNILDEIYTCFAGVTAEDLGGDVYYPVAGSYNEDDLLEIIAHVEASTGRQATVMGTAKALRNLAPSILGYDARSDLYNSGFFGRFYGSPTLVIPQRHKVGTTEFIFPDNVVYVTASDAKPIKFVYEGNSIIKLTDPMENGDMTQEYEFYDSYGVSWVTAESDGIGVYQFT